MKQRMRHTLVCLTLLALLAGIPPVPASAAGFQDVPAGHWAEDSIQRSVSLGFLQGQSATRFGMGEEISRADFMVVLSRFYGWDASAPKTSSFQDVSAGASYAGAVEAAYTHGAITTQQPDFHPEEPLTREDLAVILVRSLGYASLAGLTQDLTVPFWDVHTNTGYIVLAYQIGLMNGTSADTFSPEQAAPREEVAVTLMRLYDKLHADAPKLTAVISAPKSAEDLPDLTGLDMAAIAEGRLMGVGNKPAIAPVMQADTAEQLRAAAREAGAGTLLHITGGPTAMDAPVDETAALLAQAVADGGYDGLLLNMPEVKRERQKDLTQLLKVLRTALGDSLLCIAVEAPTWNGREYGGYDFPAISAVADQIILRVSSYEPSGSGPFPIAPVDPLEEICYALISLKGRVELSQISLMVTLAPTVWDMNGRAQTLREEELAALMASGDRQYSRRYGCAYLDGLDENKNQLAVWYLDQEAILARRQMTQLFGVQHLCLSEWDDAPLGLLTGTK